MSNYHTPALLKECIEFLNIKKGCWYIDATLGGGGHTKEILLRGGKVVGVDADIEAINFVCEHLKKYVGEGRLHLVNRNFSKIESIAREICPKKPLGILFDLGTSSYQLKDDSRGFSFNSKENLDMRMDKNLAVTAKDLINGLPKRELALLFAKYGEETYANKIAQVIVTARKFKEIRTGEDLAEVVASIKGRKRVGETHPATKVFQALRIAVNDELEILRETLPRAFRVLAPKGRMLVISFHSLEDRIVKEFGKNAGDLRVITKKPITPSALEVSQNIKARGAKLRVFEKV
ncbi:MAG: 16S rRNA (cytosine(1402)-N(4))-methyltransferase RsmH [Patescibacteria group bacterium]|nr:16S rRNA (cytosine(1402)-N(4))-methyltransferase RsmH [Patescibacteria group bacterium]